MRTTATHNAHYSASEPVLFVAFELRENTWQRGFSIGQGQKPRARTLAARDRKRLRDAVAQAKSRCGLCATAPVVSWYEAGCEGFWRHRFLPAQGITNQVVDSSSIAVNRCQRRAKSEALDVRKLLRRLMRYHHGERHVWRVVNVPSVAAEDRRHLHRDLDTVQQESARTTNRIQGLRSSQGGRMTRVHKLPEPLAALRLWDGSPVPSGVRRRFRRVSAHYQCLHAQIAAWAAERRALLRPSAAAHIEQVRQLMPRKGIGIHGSWVLVREVFGWRQLQTRREVGG